MTSSISRIATAAAVGLVLAGCGGDSEPTAEPGVTTVTSTTKASASTSPSLSSPSTAAAPAGDFTKQGTQLKFGEKAFVPLKLRDKSGTLGVTATGIKKGDPAELAPLKLGDKAAGQTPYYITFVVTNESGTDLVSTSLFSAGGLLGDGSRAQDVSVLGDFPPCDNARAPRDFTSKGASYTTCKLALASGSSKVTAAFYRGSPTEVAGSDYGKDPLVWT